jgi:NADH-quinone oxidoreductase subunit N
MTSNATISQLTPEIILILTAVLTMVGGVFWPSRSAWSFLATVGILLATLVAGLQQTGLAEAAISADRSATLQLDPLGQCFRWVSFVAGFLFLLMSSSRTAEQRTGDTPGLILVLVTGLSLVGIAGNGVMLFMALELISIPTYVLIFTGRSDRGSAEATVKYFLLSVLSSCLFLMGLAMLFGMVGSLEFPTIRTRLAEMASIHPRATVVSFMLMFCGVGFKLASFPFHFYAPDVYQGAANSSAGILAVAPKIAGIVTLVRILDLGFLGNSDIGWQMIVLMSMITMTIGNLCALWQRNVRRILAYSSIAHAGYLLIGVAVAMAGSSLRGEQRFDGFAASLLYLIVYSVASLGIFAVLAEMSGPARETSNLDELNGASRTRPWLAGAFAICLFSLSGIPPFAGFWGKLGLISAAVSTSQGAGSPAVAKWFGILAIVAVINAATAAVYYLRMIAAVYFVDERHEAPSSPPTQRPSSLAVRPAIGAASFAAFAASVCIIVLGLAPGPLWNYVADLRDPSKRSLVQLDTPSAIPAVAVTTPVPGSVPPRNPLSQLE